MAGDADVAAAAEIDDGDLDAELLPDDVLEGIGDGAGFVGGGWREGNVGHAAVPGGIVGDEGFELREVDEALAGVLSKPVGAGAEVFEADLFDEVDGGGDRQIGDGIAGAAPGEFVGPGVDAAGREA